MALLKPFKPQSTNPAGGGGGSSWGPAQVAQQNALRQFSVSRPDATSYTTNAPGFTVPKTAAAPVGKAASGQGSPTFGPPSPKLSVTEPTMMPPALRKPAGSTAPPAPAWMPPAPVQGPPSPTAPYQTPPPVAPPAVAPPAPSPAPDTSAMDALRKMQEDYLATFNQTQAEKDSSQALADIAAKQALVSSSEEMGMNKIQNTPIEMGLIQGEQAAVQRSALAQQNALKAQAVPLTTRLAQAQAERTLAQTQAEKKLGFATPTTTEVGKSLVRSDPVTGTYKSVYTDPSQAAADAANAAFTLGEGQQRYDASGKLIASGLPKSSSSDTTAEYKNWTLAGSPGTFADWLANSKAQRQPTADQTKNAGFAMRMRSSSDIIDSLVGADNPAAGALGLVQGALPDWAGWMRTDNYKQYDQARRDFVNSIMRRESGAVISDAEFANANQQYFPQPGDSAQVIAQKRANRENALKGVVISAGPGLSESYTDKFTTNPAMQPGAGTVTPASAPTAPVDELGAARSHFPPGTPDEVITVKLRDPRFRQALGFPEAPSTAEKGSLATAKVGTKDVIGSTDALSRLERADAEFYAATGTHIAVNQSYRTKDEQASLYAELKPKGARVAPPGKSFHETGNAFDVTNWQKAEPYLRKYGLVNPMADDKGHFSIGEF